MMKLATQIPTTPGFYLASVGHNNGNQTIGMIQVYGIYPFLKLNYISLCSISPSVEVDIMKVGRLLFDNEDYKPLMR
jgi:hypothetical protein